MKTLRRPTRPIEFLCDDPNLTAAAGLVTVAELDRVAGIAAHIDAAVGPLAAPRARGRPYRARDVVLGFCESQLAGGDFMCDIDTRRADTAGSALRAVTKPPASTTAGNLAKRFSLKRLVRLDRAMGELARTFFDVAPEHERDRLQALRPTLDVDPTEVECYGKLKQGFSWNYQGQWAGRPMPIVWAEAGLTLTARLLSSRQDPRPRAKRMLKKALAALPEGLGRPRFRFDSGFFSGTLASACLELDCDYAIAVPHNPAFWKVVRAIDPQSWQPAKAMERAEVAEASYHPKDWPGTPRAIVRRVRVEADEVKSDPRSRRLKTIDKEELAALRRGERDHVFAYSMILTSLDDDMVDLEHWFRERAQVEERLKDSKHGAALRHLPSGYKVVNVVWMQAAFLAMNISATLSALARPPDAERAPHDDGVDDALDDGDDEAHVEEPGGDPPSPGALIPAPQGHRQPLRAHGKRLRRETICVVGRIARHARRLVVHLHPMHEDGPMLRAYAALRQMPDFSGP